MSFVVVLLPVLKLLGLRAVSHHSGVDLRTAIIVIKREK